MVNELDLYAVKYEQMTEFVGVNENVGHGFYQQRPHEADMVSMMEESEQEKLSVDNRLHHQPPPVHWAEGDSPI